MRFRILPGILEIIEGDAKYSQIRDVSAEDLLGRETIADKPCFPYLENKVVLVTGAGGSIGSEICRQVMRYKARSLILLGMERTAFISFPVSWERSRDIQPRFIL